MAALYFGASACVTPKPIVVPYKPAVKADSNKRKVDLQELNKHNLDSNLNELLSYSLDKEDPFERLSKIGNGDITVTQKYSDFTLLVNRNINPSLSECDLAPTIMIKYQRQIYSINIATGKVTKYEDTKKITSKVEVPEGVEVGDMLQTQCFMPTGKSEGTGLPEELEKSIGREADKIREKRKSEIDSLDRLVGESKPCDPWFEDCK